MTRAGRSYAYRISIVAALGGLLFGYDTAIINGAIVLLKRQFALSELEAEIAASSILLGCMIGASAAGALGDWLGRRKLLVISAAIFTGSSIAAALPRDLVQLCTARIAAGTAIGIASMTAPLYIAEVAPASLRGRLVSLNQLAIITGILAAYAVGWALASLGDDSWRWMFLSAGAPSFAFLLALFTAPESPRWLVKERREREASAILTRLGEDPAACIADMKRAIAGEAGGTLRDLLEPALRKPLVIGLALAILQQVTGINTILYYGSIIFTEQVKTATTSAALWANVIIGVINGIFTIVALAVIDRSGRKALLMASSAGMGLSLAALGMVFVVQPGAAMLVLALILCYVACFAVGLGPGVWVLLAELFPTRVRARAMAVATVALWGACLLISSTFLTLVRIAGAAGAFWTYAALCAFTFVFLWRVVPETKGKTLEEIERSWQRSTRA